MVKGAWALCGYTSFLPRPWPCFGIRGRIWAIFADQSPCSGRYRLIGCSGIDNDLRCRETETWRRSCRRPQIAGGTATGGRPCRCRAPDLMPQALQKCPSMDDHGMSAVRAGGGIWGSMHPCSRFLWLTAIQIERFRSGHDVRFWSAGIDGRVRGSVTHGDGVYR